MVRQVKKTKQKEEVKEEKERRRNIGDYWDFSIKDFFFKIYDHKIINGETKKIEFWTSLKNKVFCKITTDKEEIIDFEVLNSWYSKYIYRALVIPGIEGKIHNEKIIKIKRNSKTNKMIQLRNLSKEEMELINNLKNNNIKAYLILNRTGEDTWQYKLFSLFNFQYEGKIINNNNRFLINLIRATFKNITGYDDFLSTNKIYTINLNEIWED